MAQEIERKFLVNIDKVDLPEQGLIICQGYIQTADKTTVRIRIMGDKAFLTLKGETRGISRSEFEYEIPVTDARQMLDELCKGPVIDKTRYLITHKAHLWELDIFTGDNKGLIIGEVELDSEDEQPELPDWITEEVSGDKRYYNSNLLTHPFKNW